jgi:disulfide bond formation protein DsbB
MGRFQQARLLALLLPAALLAGAFGSQYIGGLAPCEMCYWQRWPHEAAVVIALFTFTGRSELTNRILLLLAATAIAVSGGIGVFHAGVEYGWWEGLTQCSTMPGAGGGNIIDDIMKTPLVRCDVPQWTLFGISLAGYNAIVSFAGAFGVLRLLQK